MLIEVATVAAWCVVVARGHGEPIYRLPKTVLPTQYNLSLEIDPLGFNFSGHVLIDIEVKAGTKNITLNSKHLTIKRVGLFEAKGRNELSSTFSLEPKLDLLLIRSHRTLQSGDHYLIEIVFGGRLTKTQVDVPTGNHRVSTGPTKSEWMSSTAFEMIGARETFPCWDEPQFKARFLIILIHQTTHKALSNMPLIHSVSGEKGGWVVDHFENSPLMSSYLVTFQLLQWEHIEIKADDGRPLRLWADPKDLPSAREHLEFARKALAWLQNYTGVPEPMPKIDLVVVPEFPGAIENWGDISFGPDELLHKLPKRPLDSEMAVVAHELAHSWFGNLVTPLWWDSLWLSEGAATFFSALAIDELIPRSSHLKSMARVYHTFTYYKNIQETESPLSRPYDYMEDLLDMPQNVYYHGFSLFYMLYNSLGPDHFKTGVHRYLSSLELDNTTPRHLYNALEYQWEGKGLSELMEEWTFRGGFPVVTIERSEGQLTLKQERFILDLSEDLNKIKEEDVKWWVPISFTSQSKKDFGDTLAKLWFKDTKTIPDPAESQEWILLNNMASGIYIAQYDKHSLELIQKALESPNQDGIPETMREKLYFDFELLALKGEVKLDEVWEMHELLAHEKAEGPWKIALSFLRTIQRRLRGTPVSDLLMAQMQRLLKKKISEEGHYVLNSWLERSACSLGLLQCTGSAKLFHQWTIQSEPDKDNPIPPELKPVVYCSAMRSAGPGDWNFLLDRAIRAEVSLDRDIMYSSLGCTQNYNQLYKLLESPKKTSMMTKRDWEQLLEGLIRNNEDTGSALRFIRKAVYTLQYRMKIKPRLVSNAIRDLAEQIVDQSHLQKLTDIILLTGHSKSLTELTRTVKHQIQWKKLNSHISLMYLS